MKVPKIRVINDWFEIDEELHVDFILDIDYHNPSITENISRILQIPIYVVCDYVTDAGLLETYEDHWDYSSENVYQTYSTMSFDNWADDYMDDEFIRDFLTDYIKHNEIPNLYDIDLL